MATILKRQGKKGITYRVQIRLKNHKPISGSFRTKKEAEAFAREVEGNMHKYSAILGGDLASHTFGELIDIFATNWKGKDSVTLCRLYWWKSQFGGNALNLIDSKFIARGLNQLKTEGKSSATLNRYLSAISSAFNYAIKNQLFDIPDNPCRGLNRGGETSRFGRTLEQGEISRLLTAVECSEWPGLKVIVRLALATGARKGELLKLTWSDVDFKKGQVRFLDTKNGTDRTVPVVGSALDYLIKWSKISRLDTELVFPGGNPKSPRNFDKVWRKAKTEAEITNFRFHDLRHTAASFLADSGATDLQIAAILGHQTLQMVKRYSHANTTGMADVLNKGIAGRLA